MRNGIGAVVRLHLSAKRNCTLLRRTGESADPAQPHVQSYIDFEIGEGERERTRELYERLLQRTHHVKVWMSYADF